MKYITILLSILFLLVSCKKDPVVEGDYREEFLGTYEALKSNKEFYNDPFAMDIEVEVTVVDSIDETSILVNDMLVMLNDDGTFGEGPLEGGFVGDSIKFYTRPIANGLILPCYIWGAIK